MTDRADDSVSTTLCQCLYRRRKEACPSELICTAQEEMHMLGNDPKINLKIPIILAPMAVERKPHNVSPAARLFALVDVFDALTSTRDYKPAYGVEEALAVGIMKCSFAATNMAS